MKSLFACIAAAITLAACATTVGQPAAGPDPALAQAIASPDRSAAFRERDRYRHPQETLSFFGLQPGQTVVEIWPGLGWYAEILAPYLREHGRYIAAGYVVSDASSPQWRRDDAAALAAKFAAAPQRYDRAVVTELGLPDRWQMAPAGSADLVLTFRNFHNWLKGGYDREMVAAAYRALKPGGVFGVVDHRASPGTSVERMQQSGYVTEDYVVQLVESVGFKLQARAEINANPRDSKDYPKGVWTLPPTLALGETDRQKYLEIGESDRMTLRFVKPLLVAPAAAGASVAP
ncbi:MAG: methyltransferase [Nevskiaceae bacterium]|nr:MAG: methyltransferase [Nevskiaceae bacterium]